MIESNVSTSSQGSGGWFFNHLPEILWHRRLYVVVTAAIVFLASVIAAFSLPTLYKSTASMLVQSQDLPSELVDAPSAGMIGQRIARIRERVLSRGDLIALIEQNDLYPAERRSKPLSTVVEKMRAATMVSALENDIGDGSQNSDNTIAIQVSFEYPEPVKAQAVLQSYVASFMRMDSDDVEEQAGATVRFLQDQAVKLQTDLRTIENQVTSIKARNGAALATGGVPMLDTGSYTAQIASLENQNRQLASQARRPSERNSQLADAEAALAIALSRYSDSHPDVSAARERLAVVRGMMAANPRSDESQIIREQIAANNATIASLNQARNSAVARSEFAMAGSARAPVILEQAMQLENRASGIREQYRKVTTDLLRAQNSARMATEQRGERLSLVEPPLLPDRPHSPNRPLLMAGGAAGGLMLGLIFALLVELLGRPVRSPAQIASLGLPILGLVPNLSSATKKPRSLLPWRRSKIIAG